MPNKEYNVKYQRTEAKHKLIINWLCIINADN